MDRIHGCSKHEFLEYRRILDNFNIVNGDIAKIRVVKNGRINNTAVINIITVDGVKKYTLQRINEVVFQNPVELMKNVSSVTEHIRAKKGTSLCVNTVKNPVKSAYVYFDKDTKSYWRLYDYVEADVKNRVECAEDMYQLGRAIGEFAKYLSDFPASELVETIPDFHNTAKRYAAFCGTLKNDAKFFRDSRVNTCREEVEFIKARSGEVTKIVNALYENEIPLRVSHNDTKLNNVLFDKETGKPMCLIDLDTVMPGTVLYDFGDAARYGCNTESEEAASVENVSFNMEYFAYLVEGLLCSMKENITKKEVELLVDSVWMMTFELAIRFLDDHIDGNHYFGVEYDGKNLERARVQMALLCDIEKKYDEMKELVKEIWNAISD